MFPDDINRIISEMSISAEQNQFLAHGLRNQQTVKRVTMMEW
jgi:hypothetical protein